MLNCHFWVGQKCGLSQGRNTQGADCTKIACAIAKGLLVDQKLTFETSSESRSDCDVTVDVKDPKMSAVKYPVRIRVEVH